MTKPIPFHPLANLFPLIMGTEFDELVADVKSNGLREKIMLHEGQILDGRNRYRACIAAEIDAEFEMFSGADPVSYVISKNVHRRHLTPSQRGMAAADLCNLLPGRPKESDKNTTSQEGVSTFDAAQRMGTSRATVERAREISRKGTPELVNAVRSGKVDVATAQKAARLAPEKQAKVVAEAEAGHANVVRNVVKQGTREVREADLGKKQAELPDKKFGIILADPEWEFVVFSKTTGLDRSADNHYPTSSEEQIAARDVQKIAAQDCLLALWVTDLARGVRVMQSWGFEYKSYFVWVKDIVEVSREGGKRTLQEVGPAGTGYWNRDRDELLLIGTRGKIPAPAMGTQGESVIFAARPKATGTERGRHSAKPPQIHEWIEKHYPTLPKIELNARLRRPGWEAWGNEAPEEERSQDVHVLDVADENQDRDFEFSQDVPGTDMEIPSFLRRTKTEDVDV